MLTAYLAPEGLERELAQEIEYKITQQADQGNNFRLAEQRDRLFLFEGECTCHSNCIAQAPPMVWAQNTWYDASFIPIDSIGDGAAKLKAIQRNWALYSTSSHRRAALIEAKLPHVKSAPLEFGAPTPSSPLGSWTLWEDDLILAAPKCSSPFANGELHFVEDKNGPPNRAYLKLWEALTLAGRSPKPGELCLDLGSSPGGWTWVLANNLGARVFSIDKAPLVPDLMQHPLVEHCKGSAFALEPATAGSVDWLFCDIACYPERLLEMLEQWLKAKAFENAICTIKYQDRLSPETLDKLIAVPGARVIHLYHNKHELTWMYLK